MCDPNSIATNSQVRSALFIANETNRLANEFNKNLAVNYNTNMLQMGERRDQMVDQTHQQQSQIARQIAAERARLAAVTNESGTTGNTAARLQTEAKFAGQDAIANSQRNLDQAIKQTQWEAEAMRRQALASRRVGTTFDGLNLQIQGIQAQGMAANAQRLQADQMQQMLTQNTSGNKYGGNYTPPKGYTG